MLFPHLLGEDSLSHSLSTSLLSTRILSLSHSISTSLLSARILSLSHTLSVPPCLPGSSLSLSLSLSTSLLSGRILSLSLSQYLPVLSPSLSLSQYLPPVWQDSLSLTLSVPPCSLSLTLSVPPCCLPPDIAHSLTPKAHPGLPPVKRCRTEQTLNGRVIESAEEALSPFHPLSLPTHPPFVPKNSVGVSHAQQATPLVHSLSIANTKTSDSFDRPVVQLFGSVPYTHSEPSMASELQREMDLATTLTERERISVAFVYYLCCRNSRMGTSVARMWVGPNCAHYLNFSHRASSI